ncbi:MAG: radical SAM protein [Syntrophaceae bacterium]
MHGKKVLLVNPWVYDFAAYDLWAKPLGLLYLGAMLRQNGCRVDLIDCLASDQPVPRACGQGRFRREVVDKPALLKHIPRHYARYGMSMAAFHDRLAQVERPDVVLVTSLMTYWYPGVFEAIRHIKAVFVGTPVILGGVYATLCSGHAAAYSGADHIISGEGEMELMNLLTGRWGVKPVYPPDPDDLDARAYPCWDLEPSLRYGCILTSRGCPCRCTYCAAHLMAGGLRRRDPHKVADEIAFWHGRGLKDFAFYDDALLMQSDSLAAPMLKEIISRGLDVRFHCPNALHARFITPELAHLMRAAGFITIRLGLETSDPARQFSTGNKITTAEFLQAVDNLRRAGYEGKDIGVYLLCGLPRQEAGEILDAIRLVRGCGGRPILAEYSPIPHTGLWDQAVDASPYPLAEEPLFHNNTLLPCEWTGFTYAMYQELKQACKDSS